MPIIVAGNPRLGGERRELSHDLALNVGVLFSAIDGRNCRYSPCGSLTVLGTVFMRSRSLLVPSGSPLKGP